jgi:phospholipid transport system substrate-binding protein
MQAYPMRGFWHGFLLVLAASCVVRPGLAEGDDAQSFIQREHQQLTRLLREQPSPQRDAELGKALAGFVDYDELTKRAFGEPCPAAEPGCDDFWAGYSGDQRSEVRGLLEQLIRKNYERNLKKTLDYDVTYRGARPTGGDTKVMTEAKSRTNPREEPVRVDYVVKFTGRGLKVVDLVTEGASMTKAYYDQFRKKMHDPNEGYTNIVQKLKEKIAKVE